MDKNYLLIELANAPRRDHPATVEEGYPMEATHETQVVRTLKTRVDSYSNSFRDLIESHISEAIYSRLIIERSRDVKEWVYDPRRGIRNYQKKNIDICAYLQSEYHYDFLNHCLQLRKLDEFGNRSTQKTSKEKINAGLELLKKTKTLFENAINSCNSQNALMYVEEPGLLCLTTHGLSDIFYQDDIFFVIFDTHSFVAENMLQKIQKILSRLIPLQKSKTEKTLRPSR